jgi:hypothetical protein
VINGQDHDAALFCLEIDAIRKPAAPDRADAAPNERATLRTLSRHSHSGEHSVDESIPKIYVRPVVPVPRRVQVSEGAMA